MPDSPALNVAVIGAGWAGLAAAVEVAGHGIPVTLFEASRNLGGRARRVMNDDVGLDNGQHILIGAYTDTLALMRRVGADPDRLLRRRPLELHYASGFSLRAPRLPAPLHLAVALLAANGLTFAERLSAIRFMRALERAAFRVEPDITVGDLLRQHGQGRALQQFMWEPLCVSALNTPVDEASAQVFATVLRDSLAGSRADSDLLLPATDLGALLPDPAARYIESHGGNIQLGQPVRSIDVQGGLFRLNGTAAEYARVIIATAPHHAGALLPDVAALDASRSAIAALDYQPIYTCYLQYDAGVTLPSPMLGFTGGVIQWAFDRGSLSGVPGLIAAVVSARGGHQDMSQQEFGNVVHAELAAAAGLASLQPPLWVRVIAEKRATFSCRPGMRRPSCQTGLAGLLLAGDYTDSPYPATLESAVRSGLACARLITGRSA